MKTASGMTHITNGQLFDGTGAPPVPDAALVIAEGRIRYAGPAAGAPAMPAEARRIDARGGTIRLCSSYALAMPNFNPNDRTPMRNTLIEMNTSSSHWLSPAAQDSTFHLSSNRTFRLFLVCFVCLVGLSSRAAEAQLFARTNLVAWCIVPFDSKKRGPAARAEMVAKLGFTKVAYDWRGEHVPTFEEEILEYRKHKLDYFAFWSQHDEAYRLFAKHGLHPQIWVVMGSPAAPTNEERVQLAARQLLPVVERTRKAGCQLTLYNHGGWAGEPENMAAVAKLLREQHGAAHVGVVYNLHHGHEHLDRFPVALKTMIPYLHCLNLNGMIAGGDKKGQKILPLGAGELDLSLLKIIRDSGYRGPIGIIGHTNDDVEQRLQDNLDGLDWLLPQLEGKPAGPKPKFRTYNASRAGDLPPPTVATSTGQPSLAKEFGRALTGGMVVEGKPEYRTLPLTIECRAKVASKHGFNILVASDPKSSAEHWELYSYVGSGVFSLYLPGRGGEFKTQVDIADGQWHALAAVIEPTRVRLFVDGKLAREAPLRPLTGTPRPGGLAFGRLVEGGLGCDGLVDDVRISRGARDIAAVAAEPLKQDARTVGLWNFDTLPAARDKPAATGPKVDYWAVEDAAARAKLPLYQTIPAARTDELTPHNGFPKAETFRTWTRSHGDGGSSRFSALTQLNRSNVKNLQPAWTYHSKDGSANIQCNPIIVRGVMFAPTVGQQVVAVDAATGVEKWRFKPEGRPAFRGLLWWPGRAGTGERLFFCAGKFLHALDPVSGQPVAGFGTGGRVPLPGPATAGPAIFERTIVVPGFEKDVWGLDTVTGELRWTFHTVPHPGEFGYETWDRTEGGANCWGGMAMDEQRGIAFITTGSPKPNFLGMSHRGDNLFANCLIALDVRTGRRLWHFQEMPHDIWDLDLPAPPVLSTITRDGRRVDVVAAVSKTGNTLLLDRVSGKPVFPFRLRRAPTSTVPGEMTAPYQADVELPQPFARQEYTLADAPTRTPEVREWALEQLKSAQFGWFLPVSDRKVTVFYGVHGGAEWTGACTDPTTGRLYVSANEVPWVMSLINFDEPARDPKAPPTRGQQLYELACAQCHGTNRNGIGVAPPLRALQHRLKEADVVALLKTGRGLMPAAPPMSEPDLQALLDFLFVRDLPSGIATAPRPKPERPQYSQNSFTRFLDPDGYPACKPPWGTLNCLDLNTGKLLWKVPLGEHEELTRQGVPKTGTENFGGAIVTAGGLVFCAGTKDGKLRAFDTETGAELWSAKLPLGGYAPPATYEVNGRQFVVIAASGGGKLGGSTGDAYVAFALPGK